MNQHTKDYPVKEQHGHVVRNLRFCMYNNEQTNVKKLVKEALHPLRTQSALSITLQTPDPLQMSEILKIGGNNKQESFSAIINGTVIGYLWGQVGDGEVYDLKPREMMLEYMVASVHRSGYGRLMLAAIFQQLPVDILYAESSESNKSFWVRMGASIDHTSHDWIRDTYELKLTRSAFFTNNSLSLQI